MPFEPTASVNPFNKLIDLALSAPTLHVPVIFSLASAKGPTNAMVLPAAMGNTLLFFNNTKLCDAIFLASALLAAVKTSVADLCSLQYLYGSSNKPKSYFANKILSHALLICANVTLPSFIDFFNVVKKPSPTISMSTPAFNDNAFTV